MAENLNDKRARESVERIKRAFLALVAREPFEKIKTSEIVAQAKINIKTFYKYYQTRDDVLSDIWQDLGQKLQQELRGLKPGDLRGGVLIFYRMMESDDTGLQELYTFEGFGKLRDDYFSSEFFGEFCKEPEMRKIYAAYIGGSAEGIYRKWKESGDGRSIEELADFTDQILRKGLSGITEKDMSAQ